MTISRSELRRCVLYKELKVHSFAPVDPDSVNLSIGTVEEEDLVELECLESGLKSVIVHESPEARHVIAPESETFASWSDGLKKKVVECLAELTDWEAKLRKPGGSWDMRLLADSELESLEVIERDKEVE